jgi:hypothetical protein
MLGLLAWSLMLPADSLYAAAVPPDPPLRWWRGNLHTHTFWAGGNDFPEMVAEWYRNHGYHFLVLSEHNLLSRGEKWLAVDEVDKKSDGLALIKYRDRFGDNWVETRGTAERGDLEVRVKPITEYRALVEERNRFIMIEGEEITDRAANGMRIHMNATNLIEYIKPPSGATVQDVISNSLELVREQSQRLNQPILFHVNHPNFRWGVTAEDLASVTGNRFFEVWNGVASDNDPGDAYHPSTDEIWDIANTLRMTKFNAPPLYAVATDDSHAYHGVAENMSPGRAWVMVSARHLTPESLIRAFNDGDFYSSTGVYIDAIEFDGNTLSIDIQHRAGETFTTRSVGSRKNVNVIGTPRYDGAGAAPESTLDYSDNNGPLIGEVFAEVMGNTAAYTLQGDELYVRAVITSDAEPDVPSKEFPYKRAWTQPVGWERWIQQAD